MSAGLTTYKADGTVSFNSDTDLTSYQIGSGQTGTTDGSLSVNKTADQKVWLAVTNVNVNGYSVNESAAKNFGLLSPYFTITDNGTTATINWKFQYPCTVAENSFSTKSARPCINNAFIYGVYVNG